MAPETFPSTAPKGAHRVTQHFWHNYSKFSRFFKRKFSLREREKLFVESWEKVCSASEAIKLNSRTFSILLLPVAMLLVLAKKKSLADASVEERINSSGLSWKVETWVKHTFDLRDLWNSVSLFASSLCVKQRGKQSLKYGLGEKNAFDLCYRYEWPAFWRNTRASSAFQEVKRYWVGIVSGQTYFWGLQEMKWKSWLEYRFESWKRGRWRLCFAVCLKNSAFWKQNDFGPWRQTIANNRQTKYFDTNLGILVSIDLTWISQSFT